MKTFFNGNDGTSGILGRSSKEGGDLENGPFDYDHGNVDMPDEGVMDIGDQTITVGGEKFVLNEQQSRRYSLVKKSPFLAFVLAFFFGPFAVLYADFVTGILMISIGIVAALTTGALGGIIVWIFSLFIAPSVTNKHNKQIILTM